MKTSDIHISTEEFRRMKIGGVAEGFKAPVSKTDKQETVSQVQILPPPNPIACILDAEPKPKKSKYWNVRTEYNGRMYASKLEAEAARDLDILKGIGNIDHPISWIPQRRFPLPGKVDFYLDFEVYIPNEYSRLGHLEVRFIEIKALDKKQTTLKGHEVFRMTQSARDKIKQVEALYHIEIEITNDIRKLFLGEPCAEFDDPRKSGNVSFAAQ